jgi:ribosomal protein L3 glutamine methyltransferase
MNPPSRTTPPSTARELIYFGEQQFKNSDIFYGHGTREALDESVYLVLRGVGLPFGCPEEDLDRALTQEQIDRARALLQQRIDTRKPAAYLLNEAYFCGLSFYVDERVLIPRSPIAELIEQGFAPWVDELRTRSVLDLCTGSGCIAIGCALAFPDAIVTASDLSSDALAVAAINVERHGLGDRVRLVQSDLFTGLGGERFDLIVSNPPYVPAVDVPELPAEYGFEPALALAADDDGLAIAVRILEQAGAHLTEHGVLVVEVGDREHALAERYPAVPFTWLELERGSGDDGVFLLDAAVLREHFPARR